MYFRFTDWTCGKDDAKHDGYGDDSNKSRDLRQKKKQGQKSMAYSFWLIVVVFGATKRLPFFRDNVFAIMYGNLQAIET